MRYESSSNRYSTSATYNVGLRQYMAAVYRHMSMGLLVTSLVAYLTSTSPTLMSLFFATGLQWVVFFLPLVVVFWVSRNIGSMTVGGANTAFLIYSALLGLSLSSIFLVYSNISITRTFLITAALFGSMSIYGQTTKSDLTGFGSFFMMGMIGLVLAGLTNIFLHSDMVHFMTSAIGVILFTGLTAYDTQMIKANYAHISSANGDMVQKAAVFSALSIYLDFINMFISLLRFFGDRK